MPNLTMTRVYLVLCNVDNDELEICLNPDEAEQQREFADHDCRCEGTHRVVPGTGEYAMQPTPTPKETTHD